MGNESDFSVVAGKPESERQPVRSIGFILFPGMLQLDFTGPYGVFSQVPGIAVHLVAKDMQPVVSGDGLVFQPATALGDCPPLDMVVIPGGGGIEALLSDTEMLAFVRECASKCRYMASVCTGALVLGAAGLLRGRRATTHWQSFDLLQYFGAVPVKERVVFDDHIVTSAGVTSGIDMALAMTGRIWGDRCAEEIQLAMEYAPQPPYAGGTPEEASLSVVQALVARNAERQERRRLAVVQAASALENLSE